LQIRQTHVHIWLAHWSEIFQWQRSGVTIGPSKCGMVKPNTNITHKPMKQSKNTIKTHLQKIKLGTEE
jgi:hypothetical protein